MEYRNHLKWVIPFPGDWQVLYNNYYQKALMKAFADAGLAQLGKLSGHRAETLTSLIKCSNFKRTHRFLLGVYQAMYQFFISLYMNKTLDCNEATVTELFGTILDEFATITRDSQLPQFRDNLAAHLSSLPCTYESLIFVTFMDALSSKLDTINFWYHFIMEDCFAYIALSIDV